MVDTPTLRSFILQVTSYRQNCTVVVCTNTKKCAVIDPGGEVHRILADIERRGLTIEKIWITHGHLDHCGGAKALKAATGAPIEGPHKDDAFWIENIPNNFVFTADGDMDSFVPDRWLQDGDTVTVGETTWKVLHCPGHTPGHIVFYNKENNFAQVGDVLFRGSIGRTDLPGSDPAAIITSITHKLWPLGKVTFFPGHGLPSNFTHERQTNPFVGDNILAGTNGSK